MLISIRGMPSPISTVSSQISAVPSPISTVLNQISAVPSRVSTVPSEIVNVPSEISNVPSRIGTVASLTGGVTTSFFGVVHQFGVAPSQPVRVCNSAATPAGRAARGAISLPPSAGVSPAKVSPPPSPPPADCLRYGAAKGGVTFSDLRLFSSLDAVLWRQERVL
jgi:hypothetical protein